MSRLFFLGVFGLAAMLTLPGQIGGSVFSLELWEADNRYGYYFPDTANSQLKPFVANPEEAGLAPSLHATRMALALQKKLSSFPLLQLWVYRASEWPHKLSRRQQKYRLIAMPFSRNFGWSRDSVPRWHGDERRDSLEDFHWGLYDRESAYLDSLLYQNPGWLVLKSAGNSLGEYFSGLHYVKDYERADWQPSEKIRQVDGGEHLYDCLPPLATAKNVVTVGAAFNWEGAAEIRRVINSGVGPSDDGRIKPDLLAYGVQTSQAVVALSAQCVYLMRHFEKVYGRFPWAFEMRNLLITSAKALGEEVSPNYRSGYGLFDSLSAHTTISKQRCWCDTLRPGNSEWTLELKLTGQRAFALGLAWHDPPANRNAGRPLVADLNLTALPAERSQWIEAKTLDPAKPALGPKATGNSRDNYEQLSIAKAGRYTISVKNAGAKISAPVAFSLCLVAN